MRKTNSSRVHTATWSAAIVAVALLVCLVPAAHARTILQLPATNSTAGNKTASSPPPLQQAPGKAPPPAIASVPAPNTPAMANSSSNGTMQAKSIQAASTCVDKYTSWCASWARQGYCSPANRYVYQASPTAPREVLTVICARSCGSCPGNPSPVTRRPPPPPTVSSADWRVDMLNRVNQERARVGAPALCFNWKLRVAAERHNNDMIAGNFLDHTGRDGSDVGSRVRAAGYQSYSVVAENVLWRMDTSVANAHTQWMNSEGHRINILRSNCRHIGLARGQARDGKWYWTQVFGASFSSSEGCTGI